MIKKYIFVVFVIKRLTENQKQNTISLRVSHI